MGTGIADIKGILADLHRKGIKPLFMLEYEYHEEKSLTEVAQSVAFFNEVVEKWLAGRSDRRRRKKGQDKKIGPIAEAFSEF